MAEYKSNIDVHIVRGKNWRSRRSTGELSFPDPNIERCESRTQKLRPLESDKRSRWDRGVTVPECLTRRAMSLTKASSVWKHLARTRLGALFCSESALQQTRSEARQNLPLTLPDFLHLENFEFKDILTSQQRCGLSKIEFS